jgi:DNA polymerase III subunit gamma/tau
VIAQAGEGSVRDSLSALDQAIACCGNRLEAALVRSLLGAFSIDAMAEVTTALAAQDGAKVLELVDELERNGGSPHHFAREVSRYLRNVLVTKIAGADSRLVNASPAERAEMASAAVSFTEEDLTRYLQISLDVFSDLQASLQPRFHLEIGLLKMIQAGRLVPIEEAIASLPAGQGTSSSAPKPQPTPKRAPVSGAPPPVLNAARSGPSPFEMDRMKKAAAPESSAAEAAPAPALSSDTDWRAKLHEAMMAAQLPFSADAVLQSDVALVNNEIVVTTSKKFALDLGQSELQSAIQQLGIPGLRGRVVFGEVKSAPATAPKPAPKEQEDEVATRALSHPEVQRYRELFGGEVRTVRNLKEPWNE